MRGAAAAAAARGKAVGGRGPSLTRGSNCNVYRRGQERDGDTSASAFQTPPAVRTNREAPALPRARSLSLARALKRVCISLKLGTPAAVEWHPIHPEQHPKASERAERRRRARRSPPRQRWKSRGNILGLRV
jgi:hypothetical protein